MAKDRDASVKDDETYEALRRQGASKEKAARIANTPDAAKKGGKAPAYEQRTKDELYRLARDLDIDGRSSMTKSELITALRKR